MDPLPDGRRGCREPYRKCIWVSQLSNQCDINPRVSLPSFVTTLDPSRSLTKKSICKSIVESVLLPSPNQKREFRVAGSTQTYQELINTLGRIQGTKYQCTYTDPVEGLKKSAEAWRSGEGEAEQYSWALKTLPTGGYASLGNELDNGLLGFVPETAEQTFRRIFVK